MTHSLHRQGTPENLAGDYIVFLMQARGFNDEGARDKLVKFLDVVSRHNPVNMGDIFTGNIHAVSREEIVAGLRDRSGVHAVFTQPDTVAAVLKELKEADLGISVVVSGLFDRVGECCQKAGLKEHTVEHSLGVWGDTARLPSREVLEVSTMCGHGMVGFSLVQEMADDVRNGRLGPEEAGARLAEPCVCGLFNPARAAALLRSMAASGHD